MGRGRMPSGVRHEPRRVRDVAVLRASLGAPRGGLWRVGDVVAERAWWGGVGCLGARHEPRWVRDVAMLPVVLGLRPEACAGGPRELHCHRRWAFLGLGRCIGCGFVARNGYTPTPFYLAWEREWGVESSGRGGLAYTTLAVVVLLLVFRRGETT